MNFSFERDSAAGNSFDTFLESSVKVDELFRGAPGLYLTAATRVPKGGNEMVPSGTLVALVGG